MGSNTEIRFRGFPVNLVGSLLQVGDAAPEFTSLVGLEQITLAKTPSKPRLFSVIPSLDAGVCNMQVHRFNDELVKLGDSAAGYLFSLDLPFAQKRFCIAEKIHSVIPVSDCYNRSFGAAYAVLLEGLPMPLLTRAVFVLDSQAIIRHVEYVEELANQPDYEQALTVLKSLI
ncbi:MAG: thiol peroxidase [Planctomycetota bacterium]|nr:thiol peroxidase [Planctomycetota bacterium]